MKWKALDKLRQKVEKSKNDYQYAPLSLQTSFRVLELLPGTKLNPIEYRLIPADWTNPPRYEAISYAWGGLTKDCLTKCDGKNLKITKSLHAALVALRLEERARTLWADAVCIDQSSLGERGHQVSNMKSIYDHAEGISIWLGEDEEDLGKNALQFIHHVASLFYNNLDVSSYPKSDFSTTSNFDWILHHPFMPRVLSPLMTTDIWKQLRWLFSRSWFTRIWVIQEVNNRTNVLARCGRHSTEWHKIVLVSVLLYHELSSEALEKMGGDYYLNAKLIQSSDFRSSVLSACSRSMRFAATDPRDKIYALLGLPAFSKDEFRIVADYTKSASEVSREIAQVLVENLGSLEVLTHVHHKDAIESPSWYPHWDHEIKANPITLYRPIQGLEWHADNYILPEAVFDDVCGRITVSGIRLDIITKRETINCKTLFTIKTRYELAAIEVEEVRTAFWEKCFSSRGSRFSEAEWLEQLSTVFTMEGRNLMRTEVRAAMFQEYLKHFCAEDHLPFCGEIQNSVETGAEWKFSKAAGAAC